MEALQKYLERIGIRFNQMADRFELLEGAIYKQQSDDSRTNLSEEGGNDAVASFKDPLQLPQGPITRSRAKRFKEALMMFMKDSSIIEDLEDSKLNLRDFKFRDNLLTTQGKLFLVWDLKINELELKELDLLITGAWSKENRHR